MFILLLSWILSVCIFLFWIAEAVLPSAVACLFYVYLMFIILFLSSFFFLRSPVIWFMMFTAVNFHLVLFFLHLTSLPSPALPPAIGCCVVVVVLGGGCVILDPFYIAPGPSLLMWRLPFDLCGAVLCTLPNPPSVWRLPLVACSCCSGVGAMIPTVSWFTFTQHTPPIPTLPNHCHPLHVLTGHRNTIPGPFPSIFAMDAPHRPVCGRRKWQRRRQQ